MDTGIGNQKKTYRNVAVTVGILFIIATAFLFIAESIYGPYLNSADYLETVYPNRIKVVSGLLIEFICVIAIPLIPVFMYPLLKKFYQALALGYVVLRLLEAVLFAIIDLKRFSLIEISKNYLAAAGSDTRFFENLGNTVIAENGWGSSVYVLVFAIGALLFYSVLYQANLLPRFISGWGFLSAVLMLAGTLITMLEISTGIPETIFQPVMVIPLAVNEMVLAVWLIVRGFSQTAIASKAAV